MPSDELRLRIREPIRHAQLLHPLRRDRLQHVGADQVERVRIGEEVRVVVDGHHQVGVGGCGRGVAVDKRDAKRSLAARVWQPLRPRKRRVDADLFRAVEKRQLAHDRARHIGRRGPGERDRVERVELDQHRHARHRAHRRDGAAQAHRAHRVQILGAAGVVHVYRGAQRARTGAQAHRRGACTLPDALHRHRGHQLARRGVQRGGVRALRRGVRAGLFRQRV